MSTLEEKLHPSRLPGMSGAMAAIVAYILNQNWTEPSIKEIIITSDEFVLARQEGDIGANEFIGSFEDLRRNWDELLTAAGLTDSERKEAERRFQDRIA